MEEQLTKKYGLPTAIAMVIGIVIGSGIFFKAEKILTATGGDLKTGILAWLLGGCIAIASACAFAVMATRYEKVGGVVDYAEATVGEDYAYYLGWFMAAVYFPCLTSTLCWVSARYTCVLLGYDILSGPCLAITMLYMALVYFMNATAPRLAGKFQVSLTVIKLVPILLMAVIGTVAGLRSGLIVENFTAAAAADAVENPLFAALAATSFAYEGWVIATTINAEIKNAKRNLPLALVFGVGAIMLIYLFYYVGIAGAVPNSVMMEYPHRLLHHLRPGSRNGAVCVCGSLLPGHLQRPDDGLYPGFLLHRRPGPGSQGGAARAGGPVHQHAQQRRLGGTGHVRLLVLLLLLRRPSQ